MTPTLPLLRALSAIVPRLQFPRLLDTAAGYALLLMPAVALMLAAGVYGSEAWLFPPALGTRGVESLSFWSVPPRKSLRSQPAVAVEARGRLSFSLCQH